jgi:hypothetical protein
MTAKRIFLAGALVLGLTGLGLGVLAFGRGSEGAGISAPDKAACSSCDARHQRLGQLRLSLQMEDR